MKRIACFLLMIVLTICILPAFAEEEELITLDDGMGTGMPAPGVEEEEIELVPYDYDHITIGNPTPLNGQFFTDLWGNDTSDIDVRYLVTGYDLITWDSEISVFRFDRSVVSGAVITEDENGDRSYMLSLYDDLYYSDGTQITARDYAFSILFQSSPLLKELGANPLTLDYIVGYEDYASGNTPYISGVRVPADDLLIITVKKESLPYFYELSRLAFYPYPIHAIAPGCAIGDEGNGAFITNAASPEEPALFTASLLRETILTPDSGFLSHPDPVSGPYRILSYDGVTAEFEINPYFKGNEEGKKPRIQDLTFTVADNESMIQALGEGEFALLNKVAYSPTISEGLRLVMDNAQYGYSAYPRVGLSYFYFDPNSAPVQEQKVRQAIAHCFDKQAFLRDHVGGYGLEAEGLYGLGQWPFEAVSGTIPYPGVLPEGATAEEEATYEEALAAWDALSLDGLSRYGLDLDEAVRLLEEAGWTRNERGEPFDPLSDSVRCKEVGGELMKLELTLGYQPRADVEQALNTCFAANLAEVGIQLTTVPLEFDSIVEAHNAHLFDSLDILYFGDNFNISFDPALFFRSGDDPVVEDSLRSAYQELFVLSEDMAHTEPRDILGYMQKWIGFQEKFTELLPLIPIYSNVYFDFYTRELADYWIEEQPSWGLAIVPARMHSLNSVGLQMESLEEAEDLDLASLTKRTVRDKDDYSDGALSMFPESVREQVPPDYRTIYEFVAAKLDSEVGEDTETLEMTYTFQTPYAENEAVYLLYGIPGKGSDVDWFVKEGVGLADGSIRVELEKEQWQQLRDITFALAVVSQ